MKTYVQPGETLPLTAPYAVASGGGFLVGSIFAIAKHDAASGAPVEGLRIGVNDVAKATGEAWTAGQKVYWDNTNKRLTTTSSGNTLVGAAVQAQASGDTVGRAQLTGQIV
ncbi:DUF2190 family protein [Sphingomonas sp. 1P06PA]|uniref:DUF2190 family protein n=1 Tax=Sphingomonas sp. 1P06PA TaxID=554121 RepID=UPI0039A6D773